MKRIMRVVFTYVMAGVLLASTFSAYAIGFEAEKVYESVFVIYADNALGSGFAIGENCIVTNAHVVEDANDIYAVTYSGDHHDAYVYAQDNKLDIAILVIPDASFKALPVASSDNYKIGDDIYTIGAPDSMAYTLTKGVISAKDRKVGSRSYIQIDAPINAGNSGGPLLNDAGEVLGINTLKMSDSEGIGLSIPMTVVSDYLASCGVELDEGGNVIGTLEPPKTKNEPASDAERNNDNVPSNNTNSFLIVLLCISVLLNVALFILLINNKKKKSIIKVDPSERTDFEIDIQE